MTQAKGLIHCVCCTEIALPAQGNRLRPLKIDGLIIEPVHSFFAGSNPGGDTNPIPGYFGGLLIEPVHSFFAGSNPGGDTRESLRYFRGSITGPLHSFFAGSNPGGDTERISRVL